MNGVHILLKRSGWLIILMAVMCGYARPSRCEGRGELVIEVLYPPDIETLAKYDPQFQITLLADDEDILGQIKRLQDQSKPELEPLVKQYMYAAEALNQFKNGKITDQQQAQLMQSFTVAEKRIQQVLERYTALITVLLQRYTHQKIPNAPFATTILTLRDVAPGHYRVYGVLTYTTTTLAWFEPVHIKGGERRTITFTRDNLHNPYWTELNWWSFVNLDFSKHH
ncbi:hypothetical protein U27_03034 [Candidatus Vecturithrix granuli]|uniref:Uncharacterized protein n=1 Tax=Vecturithrix granuli TaxID=1499967 RepID=A0A081BUR7_VECG1|nr:hypothetical protein U27_03034 [Candidatus Vecturithrix granuli]